MERTAPHLILDQAATDHNASLVAYQRYRNAGIVNNRELRQLCEALCGIKAMGL